MLLKNKIVWVTGAGRGIGRATAIEFAKEGANLVINSLEKNEIEDSAELIKKLGREVLFFTADIKDKKQVKSIVKKCLRKFGRIDILVNNAGTLVRKNILETTEKDWDLVFNTNLKSIFFCIKEVLPIMIKNKKGLIINISSLAIKEPLPEITAYVSSKAGVVGLTSALAEENIVGIKTLTICPDGTDTKLLRENFPETNLAVLMKPEYVAKKIIKIAQRSERTKSGSIIYISNLNQKLSRIRDRFLK